MKRSLLISMATFAAFSGAANAESVTRHGNPGSSFPIARAVEVPGGRTTVYLSGMGPQISNSTAQNNTVASFGDMETQTVSALKSIEIALSELSLGMGDVVKMQVFLVAPRAEDPSDFAGFMRGYSKFFGTPAQPNLPARSTMNVASLINAGWLIEIEVTAVRP